LISGRKLIAAALATAGVVALGPAAALAADRYVDEQTGVESPDCLLASPCASITHALTTADPGDRILVDNGAYPENVTVGNGISIEAQDFVAADGNGPVIIDGGEGTAITVAASGAGHIRGLNIRSNVPSGQVLLNGPAEIDSNDFDDPDAGGFVTGVQVAAAGAEIHDNDFVDPAPSATRGRVGVVSFSSAVTIRDNTFTGLMLAVNAAGPGSGQTTLIEHNTITGTHELPVAGRALLVGGNPGDVIVRENLITDSNPAFGGVDGIHAQGPVALVRNRITGHENGVFVGTDVTGVTLEGDRIWGNDFDGLWVIDVNGATGGTASASATNVTIWGNEGAGFRADGSTLTLDSSIVEDFSWSGSASCTITFSRASTSPGTDPSGCDEFQTTADPMFVNAAEGDFHLTLGSPMIDMGNPADPASGAVDFDGDPRGLAAEPTCETDVGRRDIGADEFNRGPPDDCDPPETTIDAGPTDGSTINDPNPIFSFSSDDATATFECNVDGAGYGLCSHTSQHILGVDEGEHTFSVRAVDPADNVDPSPPSRSFTVDLTSPDTTYTKTPAKAIKRKRASFAFEAGEPATFACKLDSKPAFACGGSARVRLKPGRHVFRVTATDLAGNVETTPAAFRFRRKRPR
jgi:Right handed beta helix region